MQVSARVQARLLLAVGVISLGACRQPMVEEQPDEALRVTPAELSFDETFVGFPKTASVTLSSPSPASRTVKLATSLDFAVTGEVLVPGGGEVTVEVRYEAALPGLRDGVLRIVDSSRVETREVPLRAVARPVPDCRPAACRESRFDPLVGACVERLLPDGAACAGSLACFSTGQCVNGECRGARVTCDDGNPCTLDVCSDLGCGQVDGTPFCPGAQNPCLVPTCTTDAGCGLEAVPDGTACGERTCTTARICVAGACVQRTPPRNQSCADLLVGVPAGSGFVDGRFDEARFFGVVAMAAQDEHLMLVDDGRLRLVRRGAVQTIAGQAPGVGVVDGFGPAVSIGSRNPSLARTPQPGLFFLGDGTTIRLVTLQGQVSTLAGSRDAGGSVDGIGAGARLQLGSPLRPGGAGARWLQLQAMPSGVPTLLVREVSLNGAVRTLHSLELGLLNLLDGGAEWDTWLAGVAETGPEVTAHLSFTHGVVGAPVYVQASFNDGGFRLTRLGVETWWASEGLSIQQTVGTCRVFVRSDAGSRTASVCGQLAPDGDGGVYLSDDSYLRHLDLRGERVVSGPVPDRRIVDGDRDAGRLSFARSLALVDGGVALTDFSVPANRVRVAWLSGSGPAVRARLETVDAGFIPAPVSIVSHGGAVLVSDEGGRLSALDLVTGARRTLLQSPQLGGASHRLASNGTDLRVANFRISTLDLDGGAARELPGISHAWTLASGPMNTWYTFGALDGGSEQRLLRLGSNDAIEVVAGRPGATVDTDGPALQAGLTSARGLTVGPDGAVYFLGARNALRTLRNGQVTTLLEFSDSPTDLVALPDGTLVVGVDAALLRVFP